MLASIAVAWISSIVWVIPACVLLERWWPRHRAPIEWRRIALAAALFAVNLAVVRTISRTPPSDALARIVAAWVLAELFGYALHRAMHRVPWLWRIHRMHHARRPLAWHQSWWIHPLDAALFALVTTAACQLAGAQVIAALPVIAAKKLVGLLQHANIRWPASMLDHVLVTPTVHRRHHDEDLPPANFAGTFAIVDRVFGTWAGPRAAPRSPTPSAS
jgi:sterol desaturase/sphingolipid hydroxylase (fatty acid hydroxylase superfamily)